MNCQTGNRSWFLILLILTFIIYAAAREAQAAPELSVQPTFVDFGAVDLHDGFSTAAITISNIGDETLEFGPEGIRILQDPFLPGHEAFSFIDTPSTAPLEAQTSRTHILKFDPVAVRTNNANLLFFTNEPIHYAKSATLRGTGLAARISVTADSMEFSHKVITEQPSPARTITLQNTGNLPLGFTGGGIVLTGADAEDFMFEEPPSTTTLFADSTSSTRELRVSFKPLSVGEKNAQLVVTTTDIAQPVVTLELSSLALPERESTYHGLYNGYGPGVSTIGDGGDFDSLFDACMAVNDTPLTGGDWTFRIVSDLFEENNSYLGQPETNGNTITFRPALNTTATVTFTTTTRSMYSGAFAEGHFRLGTYFFTNYGTRYAPISNVVIDGSQSPGGSDVSLFFRREKLYGSCPVILIYGGCKNITIRNCNIFTEVDTHVDYSSPLNIAVPVTIITRRLSGAEKWWEHASEDIVIDGCVIRSGGTYGTAAIWHEGPSSSPQPGNYWFASGTKNLVIQNNEICTNGLGTSIMTPVSAVVTNNFFRVTHQSSSLFKHPVISIGSRGNISTETSITVTNNTINFQPGSLGTGCNAGIGLLSRSWPGGKYLISNNIISGLEASSDPTKTRAGISAYAARETTAVIAHNSIYFKASPNLPLDGKCYGIGTDRAFWGYPDYIFHSDSHISVHNNIVHVEQPGASAIHQEGTMGAFISANNVLSVVPGAYTSTWSQLGTNGWLETHATLDDRRTTTGQDMNSVSVNPFEPVAPGLGTWTRAAETGEDDGQAVADLHFTNYPGSVYLAPKIDGLETDIDGDLRSEEMVIMGADEVPHHRSVVNGWGIY